VKFRRRYQVVVEGVSGQAAAQRTVISEHRSEQEALAAAALERSRLEVIHGGGARSWRILVMLDDEVLAEEHPEAEGDDLLRSAASAAAPAAPAPAAPNGVPAGEAGAEEGPPAPPEPPEPPPAGPVPDWVIRRFEESIERRGDREEGEPGDREGPAS
jgi:hypothetical protein